ncbi:MAG: InlB B-repeat-containing protein, partial [Candidatus Methanomethylophilaceae archaeon]|nr:InlB B-repeat-containing protein [Candidatus Methanomethylophilaceae archaeon]
FGNANHTESTILSGGSNGKQENIQNTFIYIAGESQLWDAQSAGRTPEKTTVINGTIELSGKATMAHILCGATTDGNQSNIAYESIKNTHIVVKDSAKAGTVCGAGFDTSYPAVSATMKNGGSIVVEIRGGTVCDVFGGGFRAITGTAAEPIDDISITVSGGKVLGDVYGGGSGGFNKKRHNSDGTWGAGFANADGDNDTTGRSRVYVNEVNIVITGDAVIEGSVYGGGKSVPAIRTYSGATRDNLNSAIARGDVAALICDQISVTVNDRAEVKGDVFGGGRGVPDITPAGTIAGENARNYTDMISISKDGEREYLPWYTSNNSSSGVAVFLYDSPANPEDGYLYGYAKVSGPYVNGSPTKADISVAVTDNAKVGSCVLGAGGRSLTYADTSVVVDGNAQVGGSVYGAGLMRMLTGDTDVYIGGGADIAYSVYGGGDVGVRDSDVDTALILVTGNSHVAVDGSEGANVGKSIMGDGNSGLVCDADGNPSTRIVEITDYSPEHVMESLQNASSMSLVRSSVALSGRASSASATPSDLMSLYNIDDLMLIGGSSMNLRSGMHNVRGYGSYVDMTMTPTTLSHPLNSVKVGAGVMFNTAYDDVDDIGNPYTKYGIISGYTILGHDISDDYYGAFAYGNLGSEGRFVQYKEGLLELIPFVDKSGGDDHDPFKLWTMIGSIKQTVSLVAVGNGTTEPQNTSTMFEIIPVSNDGKMEFMGSSIVMSSSEAHLVENVSDIDGYDDFRMTFGYGDPTKFLTFNDGAGATILPDASEILMGSEASSFCKVNISLDYWGTQKLTGLIGQVYLEIQEVLTMEVDGAPVQVPVCTNIVCVNLYCSESMSSFAREDRVVEHAMTILIDKSGNGSGSFVIPYGYRNGILVMTEADDAGVTVDMRTAVNSYGSQGWIGAVGKGGLIEDCVGGEGYKLSGSFSATLAFTITGAEDLSARPYMEFTITDTTVKKFSLTINLAEVPDYTVKFYSQKYDYDALRSVVKGGDVSVPEPPYALAKTTHVEHGHQILKSQYPITYDNFVGWYRDPDCTRHFDTTMEVTENMELYAKYAFSTTFEIPSGNEVVPVPVVTKDVAHMEALYEDPDAPATATFGPDAAAIEGHIGEMIELPEPASTAGFKGWAMDGRIYAAGDEIPMFKDSMAFTAVYEDSGTAAQVRFYEYVNNGRNTALLRTIDTHMGAEVELPGYTGTSSGFVGWTCQNAFYEQGTEVVVASDVMDFIALIADGHNASILYGYDIVAHVGATISLPVPPDNDFRGWLIDGKLYEPDADGCPYTVTSLEDIDAIPVYRNDIIDVDVIYVDGSDETSEERKFGETFALPENQKEGFLGWYYDGLNYGSGTLFTVYSDEPARLMALYEGECTIYTFQENEPGSVGWVWNGRFYEGGRMLIVPSGVEVNPTALYEDASAVVSVDAGRSAVLEKLKVGQSVTLPSPSEGNGFKGWVADGHLYMPGDQYRIMNDYSPLYKLVLSDDALAIANPGYTTNGEWYDLDDMKRFDNVNMSEHVIGNTTYRLKWEGLPVQIEFIALDGDQPIDMSAYDGVTIVYGSTFGNNLTEAAEHVKSVAQLKDMRWEILKPQDGEPARSGLYVYEGDVFSLPSFDAYTETSGDVRTIKLFADASDAAITVELTPGQQYVPHSASAVEFEAVYIKASDEDDPSTWATALFEEGGTQIADPV